MPVGGSLSSFATGMMKGRSNLYKAHETSEGLDGGQIFDPQTRINDKLLRDSNRRKTLPARNRIYAIELAELSL